VDRGVIATATELFAARHFPGVVAMCNDALDGEPDCVELMVIRARAHIALRRDLEAQADLRDIIRLDPQCAIAYRLLGELAARRDENESAAIFFREAIRLDPDDTEAHDWLAIVDVSLRPAAVAKKLPAPATAAGRFPRTRAPIERGKSAADTDPAHRSVSAPARAHARPGTQPRFARGTRPPAELDERPAKPFPRGSEHDGGLWRTPEPERRERTLDLAEAQVPPAPAPHKNHARMIRIGEGSAPAPVPAPLRATPLPLPPPPAPPARTRSAAAGGAQSIAAPRPATRSALPELPGFGDYLVGAGILSRERLRAAQAYQRSMKVQLSTAIVTLGLASPQRIEWAAVAHQSQLAQLARERGY
jgi:hypothetical protein